MVYTRPIEVGLGANCVPDARFGSRVVYTRSGAHIGLHPVSELNNPEPEIVLAVSSAGRIVGGTLCNDVDLRDVEGRSALLLSKAKDNNASCVIGPMIRLFDTGFSLDVVRTAELELTVSGSDGFVLKGHSSIKTISRDPEDLVAQTIGRHHQYPYGFMLFLGTLFAPTEDRDVPGEGFTQKIGDIVSIESSGLGRLTNRVVLSFRLNWNAMDILRQLEPIAILLDTYRLVSAPKQRAVDSLLPIVALCVFAIDVTHDSA